MSDTRQTASSDELLTVRNTTSHTTDLKKKSENKVEQKSFARTKLVCVVLPLDGLLDGGSREKRRVRPFIAQKLMVTKQDQTTHLPSFLEVDRENNISVLSYS